MKENYPFDGDERATLAGMPQLPGNRIIYNPFDIDPVSAVLEDSTADEEELKDEMLARELQHHEMQGRLVLRSNFALKGKDKEGQRITKLKVTKPIERGYKPLTVVKDDDVVIINAHGGEEKVAIGYRNGLIGPGPDTFKMRVLSASALASMIKRDGLSPPINGSNSTPAMLRETPHTMETMRSRSNRRTASPRVSRKNWVNSTTKAFGSEAIRE